MEAKITDSKYQLDPNNQRRLLIKEKIFEVWPEPPPDDQLHIFVGRPATSKRNITHTELALDIKIIDQKIKEELDSLRGMVETFLKNPEPPIWNPPDSVTPSEREFLTNLRIPSYRDNYPTLLFHNLDVCDDEEIETIFGSTARQYVVINCALNTSQHV